MNGIILDDGVSLMPISDRQFLVSKRTPDGDHGRVVVTLDLARLRGWSEPAVAALLTDQVKQAVARIDAAWEQRANESK